LEKLAVRITGCLVRNNVALEKDQDIYVFGLIHLFSHSITLIVAVVLGIVLGILMEMTVFFAFLTAGRMSAGGYHASSFWKCIILSILTILAAAITILYCPTPAQIPINVISIIFSVIIVFSFAPVVNQKRPLSAIEVLRFRNRSRISCIVSALLICILVIFSHYVYSFSAALGLGISTISIMVALVQERLLNNISRP